MAKKRNPLTNPAGLAAWLAGDYENMERIATPGGIEQQEADGQRDFVANETLPRHCSNGIVGSDARPLYEALGIEVLGDVDDLFYAVRLPEGWRKVAESHAMWSRLEDAQGRERGSMFYKAAFYDRNAHFSLTRRFHYGIRPTCGWGNLYEQQSVTWEGYVTDCKQDVFVTEPTPAFDQSERSSLEEIAAKDFAETQAKDWLREQYPDFENPMAYWAE